MRILRKITNLLAIFGASNPSKPNGRDSRGFVEKIVSKEIS
jgi:hypothetical protein